MRIKCLITVVTTGTGFNDDILKINDSKLKVNRYLHRFKDLPNIMTEQFLRTLRTRRNHTTGPSGRFLNLLPYTIDSL